MKKKKNNNNNSKEKEKEKEKKKRKKKRKSEEMGNAKGSAGNNGLLMNQGRESRWRADRKSHGYVAYRTGEEERERERERENNPATPCRGETEEEKAE